jgi:hypothetical protein
LQKYQQKIQAYHKVINFLIRSAEAASRFAICSTMLSTIMTQSPWHIFAVGVVIVLVCMRIRRHLEIRAFKKAHACEPPIRAPQKERIIGWSAYQHLQKTRREHVSLQQTFRRAMDIGRTNTAVVMGQEIISTCDPENIKTVLAANFKDYGIGPRMHAMGPLLGKGIFTTDDEQWQHSRVRPTFSKFISYYQGAFIADLE